MRTGAERVIDAIWYGRSPLRWPLWPISLLFRAATSVRSAAYRRGVARSAVLAVPVVVVGNITSGGTGKTPFVVWLAAQLKARGWSPGIVTRGYRGRAGSWPQRVSAQSDPGLVGDEPVLLAARTACPVVAGPDRVAAARRLLADAEQSGYAVDVLLSDDGLQHYRLARAFEIAVVDGVRGFGNALCLPAGPLREPVSRLRSVDAVVVNDGAHGGASVAQRGASDDAHGGAFGGAHGEAFGGATRARFAPSGVLPAGVPEDAFRMSLAVSRVYRITDGEPAGLAAFAGRTVHAVAGIAHPERFFRMLEAAGIDVIRHPLPDHADIAAADLRHEPAAPVLVTEKDAVKCRAIAHGDVWCAAVDAVVEAAAAERLTAALVERLRAKR